jgi:NAD(P)-dependent dehydrogenase (short-subunit alcohol dehydrogenase family)
MPADSHTVGLGASDRHQSSRSLRAWHRYAPRARGRRRRPHRVGQLRSPVKFDDIHFLKRAYEPWDAYAQSKTANVLFAVEATRRWANDGITANALQPGTVRSNLQRYIADEDLELTRIHIEDDNGSFHWKTPEQGAATSVLPATSPLLEGIGGRYFEDCNEGV